MIKILIIGAFDRYNYGDLLFPLIIEKQLSTYGLNFSFQFFGLVKSDLSAEGGPPTQDLQEFYEACDNPHQKVNVIIAGGEALGVTWNSLYAALNPFFQKVNKRHVKLSKVFDLNGFTKRILKGKTTLPFVFESSDFRGVNSVILNSLGGSGLKPAVFEKYKFLKQKLQKAEYFAVRDKITQDNLHQVAINAHLFPDSAILMSEFYPVELLIGKVTQEVKDYVKSYKGQYAFVQINKKTTSGKLDVIAEGLDKVHRQGDTRLCLCPIGKALDHDDHEALHELGAKLKSEFTYFDAHTIWDIMYLIANSKCYIGTSLHGAITAMSYAVSHVGLKVEKLDAYLGTWGVKGNQFAVEFSQIYEQFNTAVSLTQESLVASRDKQFREIKKAFGLMVDAMTKA